MLSFILLGLYSLRGIPLDRLPDVDFPVVSVVTTYPGADPYVVDVNVTRVIEDQLATINGIEAITSQSFAGTSRITVTFSLEKDIDVAAQEVRDAVQRAMKQLPPGVDPPVVRKVDTSLAPVLAVLLHSPTADYQTLAYWADKVIKREFERISGVGQVDLGGFRDNVMWVRIDPEKLYGRQLAVTDVLEAIQKNYLDAPAGAIYGTKRDYILRLYGKARDSKELEEIFITPNVRLGDVGYAYFGEDEKRGMARFMGEQAIAIVIYKQSKTNTVATVDAVKAKMEELSRQLPPGLRMDITFDSSVFVKDSVKAAIEEIVIGSLLTALVVYVFLGRLRLTLVPVFAIPVTLLGTVFLLRELGLSLNTFTLLALAVAVGIVIDDAIVVLESIYRRREEGLEPLQAGEIGTRIVIFALLASTASLVIVFLPVIFLKGVVGKLFGNFALTLVLAIALSYIVAVSFTPMAVSRLVKEKGEENLFVKLYASFEERFDSWLRWSLDHKITVLLLSAVAVGVGFVFLRMTPKEFFPLVDEGRFLVRFETPVGSSFDYTESKARQIEDILKKNPYVDRFGMALGQGVAGRPDVNGGLAFVYLKDRSERPHQKVIMEQLRKQFSSLKDVRVSVESAGIIGPAGGRQVDIQYVIKGPDLQELQRLADSMVAYFKNRKGYRDVDTDLRLNEPQVRIYPDREKLRDLGVPLEQVSATLNALLGKLKLGTYELGAESYDLYVKATPEFITNVDNLKKVFVRSMNGSLVPLTEVVGIEEATGYHVVNRYNRQYSFSFFANLEGKPLGSAVQEVEDWLRQNLPPGYTFEPAGQAKEFARAFRGMGLALFVALLGVYMVLASLFESYRYPLIVLLMVPLAVMGSFGLLLVSGTSLSVPSYFGIILLVGIIVRDAVLFIERIIQLQTEGLPVREAILQARRERLRPILMTTLTVVASLTPVALGLTAGSELRKPLALAVIGGIFSGLPLSLFLLPVLYEITSRKVRYNR